MPRHVPLDNAAHRDLRIATAYGRGLGDEAMSVLTFPGEFRALQAYYPIVFGKDAQGRFQPLALLGLRPGQNVFLHDDAREGWDAHYVPLAVERQPFGIGADAAGEPVLHVDLAHPRIDASGAPLFLEHGGQAPVLERKASVLRALHEGSQANAAFIDALLAHGLLEPFTLRVKLPGDDIRLDGCYTIAEERLHALDATALHALATAGWLEPVYMAIASLSHVRDLIGRLQARGA